MSVRIAKAFRGGVRVYAIVRTSGSTATLRKVHVGTVAFRC